jgi:hypothetical protein
MVRSVPDYFPRGWKDSAVGIGGLELMSASACFSLARQLRREASF